MRHEGVATDEMTDAEFEEWLEPELGVDWREHITQDPRVAFGKPVVRGTRIAAQLVLERFAAGWTTEQVLEGYPHLTREQIRACFAFGALCVSERRSIDRHRQPLVSTR
jgi:uncharacterized protein (DUF433 family)